MSPCREDGELNMWAKFDLFWAINKRVREGGTMCLPPPPSTFPLGLGRVKNTLGLIGLNHDQQDDT